MMNITINNYRSETLLKEKESTGTVGGFVKSEAFGARVIITIWNDEAGSDVEVQSESEHVVDTVHPGDL